MPWASNPLTRNQHVIFSPVLDDSIDADHPVRAFDAILSMLPWDDWEDCYSWGAGRPPIHPRKMAALILYGMTKRIRSSRQLEDACRDHLDITWLMEGHRPDHSTICNFRTRHKDQLSELFKKICRMAHEIGVVRLNTVAVDGTAIRANSSRHATLTLDRVDAQLEELKKWIDEQLDLAAADDAKENEQLGEQANRLSDELVDAKKRRAKLEEARKTLEEIDKSKRGDGKSQLPKTDPDSRILPNKDGGYAPNYTMIVSTDTACGFIVDFNVIQGNAESEETTPAMDRIAEIYGQTPEDVLADGGFAKGPLIDDMAKRDINFYSPLESVEAQEGNPAKREDPTQPVPAEQLSALPKQGGHFTKAAFVYDEEEDLYYCPAGQKLPRGYREKHTTCGGRQITRYRYAASPEICQGCPLKPDCTAGKSRTIRRDEYAEVREAHARKMQTEEAKEKYRQRMGPGEAPFGFLKGQWGIRQMMLRGIEKVNIEMTWIISAFNLQKLINHQGNAIAMRALPTNNSE